MAPDVSVIIPTYNRASLVRDAIDSALRQRIPGTLDVEVIVIDDASTDETPEVLESYGDEIRSTRQDANGGQCVARNRGLDIASGRYLKFLDSDDVLCDGTLADEVALADEKGADIVVSAWVEVAIDRGRREIDSTRRSFPAPVMDPMPDAVLWGRAVPTGAALYSADAVENLRWDMSVTKLADWNWFCMAALRSRRIVRRESPAYEMRAHHGSRVSLSQSMLQNAVAHHHTLSQIEQFLVEGQELTESRRRRLAQYFYKELRVLSLYDRAAFETAVGHILQLDSRFVPRDEERQWWMRAAGRVIGFRNAILLHTAVKRFLMPYRAGAYFRVSTVDRGANEGESG